MVHRIYELDFSCKVNDCENKKCGFTVYSITSMLCCLFKDRIFDFNRGQTWVPSFFSSYLP